MGCNVTKHPPKVEDASCKDVEKFELKLANNGNGHQTPDNNNHITTTTNNNHLEINHYSIYNCEPSPTILPRRSHSVSLGNGSSRNDDLPCGKALIIINKTQQIPTINTPVVLPNQTEDKNNYFNHSPYASPLPAGDKKRRSSEPIISSVSPVSRAPVKTKTLSSNGTEIKSKFTPFGERNRRLTLTQDQKEFFRLLDEKIAGGKDYNSEDDKSIASFKLFKSSPNMKSSNHHDNSGLHLTVRPQGVR